MNFQFFTFVSIFFILQTVSAGISADDLKKSLVKKPISDPLINEPVVFVPIENHHFNLEAPQECGKDATRDPQARKITCQFHSSGERRVKLSVCDDKKTYCKPEYVNVAVQVQNSETPRIKVPAIKETKQMQLATKKKLMADFKELSPDQVKKFSIGKKGILVMVSTEWCPPCNVVKEFLLPTSRFKEITSDFLLVYVDGDSPAFDQWRPLIESFYYPSYALLNHKLELIDLTTGAITVEKMNSWLSQATQALDDPMKSLKARVDQRISGNLFRKVKDIFTSEETKGQDTHRLIRFLGKVAKFDEKIKYMKTLMPQKYRLEILDTEYVSLAYGMEGSKLTPELRKEKMNELARKILEDAPQEDSFFHYIATGKCKSNEDEDAVFAKEDCSKYLSKALDWHNGKLKYSENKFIASEKLVRDADLFYKIGEIKDILGEPEAAQVAYGKCMSLYSQLEQYTPLGKKSRAVRFEKLYCMKGLKNNSNKLNLIKSLVRDYPYDETFHRMLSKHYREKKDYVRALSSNDLALRYAYGDSWVRNVLDRVRIYRAMGKDASAYDFIKKNLGELQLTKDGKKTWWMKSIRKEYEALKEKLSNS